MVCKWIACMIVLLVAACGGDDPVPTRIRLMPDAVTLDRGDSTVITAFYVANESSFRAGGEVSWLSDTPAIATVRSANDGSARIDGVGVGTATITATGKGLTTTLVVTVDPPAVDSLVVAPMTPSIAAGLTVRLIATASLADGATVDVSDMATWQTSAPTIATVDTGGVVSGVAVGSATITATFGGVMASATVTVTPARLVSIEIAPSSPTVAVGRTTALTATGTYTDGSLRNVSDQAGWTSSVPPVADVGAGGVVTGVAVGSTMISAAVGTVRATVTLNVTAAELVSLVVTPALPSVAAGQSQQFTATGTFSDASTANVTTMVTWTSTVAAVATISNLAGSQGRATAVATGNTVIRAAMGTVQGETSLTVTPAVLVSIAVGPGAVTVPLGRMQAFTATGTYSDGAMADVTATASWASSNQAVATVSNVAGSKGRATTRAVGLAIITASVGPVTGNATLSVGPAALESLTVEPADPTLPIGATRQMRAIGSLSDGTTPDLTATVTWTSSLPARATITAAGLARGVALGAVTITAQQGTVSGMTSLTVTAPELVSIAVTPPAPTVVAGQTQQFTATGTYTDGATVDVTATATWVSASPGVASVSDTAGSKGLATTLAGGTAVITATVGAVVGSATLTSNAATVTSFAPADGVGAIRPVTPVAFTFSQAMLPASLTSQITAGPCTGSLQLSRDNFATCLAFTTTGPTMTAGDTVATLVPEQPFVALARYRLRVTTAAAAATGIGLVAIVAQPVGFTIATDGECAAQLVISQVYGGGGNAGAPILHDFIELHNPGPTPVDLAGKAIQFVSAAGTGAWAVQALPVATVPPGGYYLIREAAGAGAQPALADPDFTPASPFAMGASSGKVALTATTTPLTGGCPLAATLDLVGYGGTASCFEGAAPVAAPANATAVIRAGGGCTDRNLASDFAVLAPAPRNGLTAPSVCVCYVNETDLQSEVDYCNLQFPTVVMGPAPLALAAVYGRVFEAGVTEAAGASPLVRMAFGLGANDSDPTQWPWVDATFNVSVGNDDEYQAPLTFAAPGEYDFTARATRDGTNWTLCDTDGAGANPFLHYDQFQTGAATIQ